MKSTGQSNKNRMHCLAAKHACIVIIFPINTLLLYVWPRWVIVSFCVRLRQCLLPNLLWVESIQTLSHWAILSGVCRREYAKRYTTMVLLGVYGIPIRVPTEISKDWWTNKLIILPWQFSISFYMYKIHNFGALVIFVPRLTRVIHGGWYNNESKALFAQHHRRKAMTIFLVGWECSISPDWSHLLHFRESTQTCGN